MKEKKKARKPRVVWTMNPVERIHTDKRGKRSYSRIENKKEIKNSFLFFCFEF